METAVTTPRQKIITKIEANPALASRKNSNRPLNVAAYCRVSTDAEDQINSYRAQVSYYTEHINQNPKWRFVNVYADEAVIIGLKPPSINGRRFSPISITGHFPI